MSVRKFPVKDLREIAATFTHVNAAAPHARHEGGSGVVFLPLRAPLGPAGRPSSPPGARRGLISPAWLLPGAARPAYIASMCGRVIQKSRPGELSLTIVGDLEERDKRWSNVPPRYNGAPSQDLWIIRRNPTTGERSLDLLRWGLVPHFCAERPKPPPINAPAETLLTKTVPPNERPFFAEAYRRRRCIMPIDGFFEWNAVKGEKVKQPFAIAMKDGSPFGLGALWENWKDPETCEWLRTFCVDMRVSRNFRTSQEIPLYKVNWGRTV